MALEAASADSGEMFGVAHQSGSIGWPLWHRMCSWRNVEIFELRDSPVLPSGRISYLTRVQIGVGDLLMKLENMSAAKLKNLRAEVVAMILVERRQHLEAELSKLAQIVGERPSRNSKGGAQSIAVKYRNPENASQIWSGRGRRPLWLDAQIKAGKELELFLAA
jgi:DNA-binding protein H-NS